MKKIIVINGSGISGKDEVVKISRKILVEKIKAELVDILAVVSLSSIDAVKHRALSFDWDGKTKDDKSRRLLSDLKDSWTRYNDGPFNDIKKKISMLNNKIDWIVFVHIREPNEIKKMVDYYDDVKTLLIKREGVEKFNNHADRNIEIFEYDYIIENSGSLDDLNDSVFCFLKDLKIL